MARPDRQAPELELAKQPADLTFRELDIEACLDLGLKIDAAPPHHTVHGDIRAGFDQPRKGGQLCSVQPRPPARPRPVAKTIHSRCVVADHPVPQRLTIHAASPGRRRARGALQHQGQRHQPTRLITVLRPPGMAAQFLCRKLGPGNCQRHADLFSDPVAQENRTSTVPANHFRVISSDGWYNY
jgi:hypothetical protein